MEYIPFNINHKIKKIKTKGERNKRVCEIIEKESNSMALSKPSAPFQARAVSCTVASPLPFSHYLLISSQLLISCVPINQKI